MWKMHAMCGYPYLQPFLNRAQTENVSEALLAVEERKQQLEDYLESVSQERIWVNMLPQRMP